MRVSRLFVLALLTAPPFMARAQTNDPYTLCSLYPQGPTCELVYQQALKDQANPAARSVRDAFGFYARYLKPAAGFTGQDDAWLKDNGIVPPDLTPANLAGLHNVINDPALANDLTARRNAVNNFISRALEAELYCGFNNCAATPAAPQPG